MLDLTGLWAIADLDRPDLKPPSWTPVTPPRLHAARRGRAGRRVRGDPRRRHPGPPPVRVVRRLGRAVHHPGRRRPRRPDASSRRCTGRPATRRSSSRSSGPPSAASRSSSSSRSRPASTRRRTSSGRASWSGPAPTSSTAWSGSRRTPRPSLVVRREGSGLRRYVHIGTGNYNPKTARLYVDLGLLTCRPELGADVTDLFNVLTGLSRQRTFRRLLVAPHSLRSRFLDLVEREIGHAAAGRAGADRAQAQRDRRRRGHRGALPGVAGRRRDRPDRPRRLLAPAGPARASPSGSASARSSASSSSTRGSGASTTAATASGTSARPT